jgi:hypothetical protein
MIRKRAEIRRKRRGIVALDRSRSEKEEAITL